MINTNTNAITLDNALFTLSDIETARINWEAGSYKKSNEELYSVLDRCQTFYQQIKIMKAGKRKLIKTIDVMLIERGMPSQKNTSLTTKVVRFVFGDCGKRAFTYATVINVADLEKPDTQSMHAFITDRGGIEEIRKTANGQPSQKEKRAKLIEGGEERVASAQPLLGGITLIDDLQPDNDNGLELMAVLMRKDADGTGSIVYRSNNETIINSLLAAYERDAIADDENATTDAAPGKAATSRAATIKEAAAV
ncbi:hypothetical protein [Novosphingobium sp. PASSN1]|uniref:hypothetical protein n=1 Tax=Novosphingobium sp. PASSN1 TaxID=2015561 RepID=UPI000BD5C3F3|nr:hypothetical protein [Novosphingobium sp. PASSN1]OYU33219.1 MAG: hypothetical protein CFE35_21370 [Novosphingobium sp. PASSN1]